MPVNLLLCFLPRMVNSIVPSSMSRRTLILSPGCSFSTVNFRDPSTYISPLYDRYNMELDVPYDTELVGGLGSVDTPTTVHSEFTVSVTSLSSHSNTPEDTANGSVDPTSENKVWPLPDDLTNVSVLDRVTLYLWLVQNL